MSDRENNFLKCSGCSMVFPAENGHQCARGETWNVAPMPSLHTVNGCTWPTVASRSQRLAWVAAILDDEGLTCHPEQISIVRAILTDVAADANGNKKVRLKAFKALLQLPDSVYCGEDQE